MLLLKANVKIPVHNTYFNTTDYLLFNLVSTQLSHRE